MKAGLVGKGIGASLTPEMHMAEGRAQGLAYRYDRFDTADALYSEMPLEEIFASAVDRGYAGLNVTHPFKLQAARLVDQLHGVAETLGAINTVVFRDGRSHGYNTDYIGFRSALARDLSGAPIRSVLLIGAGGAGGAVARALIDQGAERLVIFDKNPDQAQGLLRLLAGAHPRVILSVVETEQDIPFDRIDGIVNATPMGMDGYPGTAIDAMNLSPRIWVADIVYFPLETALLSRARMRGCRVMNGAGMAVFQAVASFDLFTGHRADAVRMETSFDRLLRERRAQEEELTS